MNHPEPMTIPNIIGLGPEIHNCELARISIREHKESSIAIPLWVKKLGTYQDNTADMIR
tara:strand:- start:3448 stop:3624 length:177 start_codon:yes stop_codon:yes gene_type:complete